MGTAITRHERRADPAAMIVVSLFTRAPAPEQLAQFAD